MKLIQNAGLLLAMTFVYSLILPRRWGVSERRKSISMGIIFGLSATVIMFNAVELGPGFRFDGRSVIVAVACLFGGPLAGAITGGIITPVRFMMGGAGGAASLPSLLTIVVISTWYRRRYGAGGQLRPRQLLVLGVLVWAQTLFWTVVFAPQQGLQTVAAIWLPGLILNPLTLYFVSSLLSHETRRAELENALRESEQRFRQIADFSDEVFWIYDPYKSQPIYVSPAYSHVWGRPVESLYANFGTLLETIHPEDRERVERALSSPNGLGAVSEIRVVRPDGELRWVAVHVYPVLNPQGKVERLVGTAEDVTGRKNAETQKLELQVERARGKMLREFINAASHDLRTPITVMGTSLYLLGRTSQPEQKTYIDQIETQVYRMRRLVDDMMAITRLDADDVGFALEPRALNEFADQAIHSHLKEATTKERVLMPDFAPVSPWARIDSVQLGHALERLIKNAIAYTDPGDHITVGTALEGQEAVITIADTGQGIEAQDLPHIFERFYRADKARGITSGGAGLGLSIAKRIVELHNGRIEVESVPDQGSTFRVILPAVAPDEAAPMRNANGKRLFS